MSVYSPTPRDLARRLALRVMKYGEPASIAQASAVLKKACAALPGGEADEELGALFRAEFICALLAQANAVYGFLFSDRELVEDLLPVWSEIFASLERPGALLKAFQRHYRESEDFPVPARILAWLPETALAQPWQTEPEPCATPGLGRQICEKIKEECRVLKFRRSGE